MLGIPTNFVVQTTIYAPKSAYMNFENVISYVASTEFIFETLMTVSSKNFGSHS